MHVVHIKIFVRRRENVHACSRLLKAVIRALETANKPVPESLAEALTNVLLLPSSLPSSESLSPQNAYWTYKVYAYAPCGMSQPWRALEDIETNLVGTDPLRRGDHHAPVAYDRPSFCQDNVYKENFPMGPISLHREIGEGYMMRARALTPDSVRPRSLGCAGLVPLYSSNNILEGGTGCHEWEAGFYLAEYILSNPNVFKNKQCFEIGSGVGLVGTVLGRVGAGGVVCSDGDTEAVENCVRNLKLNGLYPTRLLRRDDGKSSVCNGDNDRETNTKEMSLDATPMEDLRRSETCGVLNAACGDVLEAPCSVACAVVEMPWQGGWTKDIRQRLQRWCPDSINPPLYDPDVILGADLLYDPEVIPALLSLLEEILTPSDTPSSSHSNDNDDVTSSIRAKWALLATTRRNEKTFEMFLKNCHRKGEVGNADVTFRLEVEDITQIALQSIKSGARFCNVPVLEFDEERIVFHRITKL